MTAMQESANPLPMWKYSMAGFAAAIIFNVIAHQILKLSGSPVSVAVSFAVGGLVAFWFAKSEKRTPTPIERTRFLWQYGAAIGLLLFLPLLFVFRSQSFTIWVPLTTSVHWAAYLIGAYLYLSDKYLGKSMKGIIQK
jgi:uncharacterized membrane protein